MQTPGVEDKCATCGRNQTCSVTLCKATRHECVTVLNWTCVMIATHAELSQRIRDKWWPLKLPEQINYFSEQDLRMFDWFWSYTTQTANISNLSVLFLGSKTAWLIKVDNQEEIRSSSWPTISKNNFPINNKIHREMAQASFASNNEHWFI